jgi:hypothetical protein
MLRDRTVLALRWINGCAGGEGDLKAIGPALAGPMCLVQYLQIAAVVTGTHPT